MMTETKSERALLGGGCFWCLEACYLRVEGVIQVISGYAGGSDDEANYSDVCSGNTKHAEVVEVEFDPTKISYEEILAYFWLIHDPTQLNRQGGDVGKQYRSVIYYYSDTQRQTASQSIESEGKNRKGKIATTVEPTPRFYPAEKHHQNYFDQHPGAPYCQVIINPKLKKAGLKNKKFENKK